MNIKPRSASIRHTLGVAVVSSIIAVLPLSTQAVAESVAVPVGSQGGDMQKIARPMSGETKQAVEQRFGQPMQVKGPVGKPPITTWMYDKFTVYFEYDRVIHSVLNPHK